MTYKFTFISDENEDFVRVIEINSEATFLDLHKAILSSVGYGEGQMTSFFTCTDDWEKEQEVTLIEIDDSSEFDNLTMEKTPLEELIFDEKQKVLYVFDPMFERAFFGELTEIITHKSAAEAVCTQAEGKAPAQEQDLDDMSFLTKEVTIDEDFYGDSDYNLDELDAEGYGDLEFDER